MKHLLTSQKLRFCYNRHLCFLLMLFLQPVVAMGEVSNFLWGGSSISFLCFLRYLPKASTETTGNSNSEECDIRDQNCNKLGHNFIIYL